MGFKWVALGFMGFKWVSLGPTGFYWVSLSFNAVYWVLKWVTLGFSGFYWVLLSFNSVALSFVPTMTNQSVFFVLFKRMFSVFLLKKAKLSRFFSCFGSIGHSEGDRRLCGNFFISKKKLRPLPSSENVIF